jgi:Zn-dependent peptidase ImmA (M78 family)
VNSEDIISKSGAALRRCECRDPFKIARELGIEVKYDDYGKLKGMYTIIKRNPYIFINNTLDRYTQHLVCAHEIGHDRLHRDLVRDGWMREFVIYNMNNRPEYEANLFASEVLIDDDEILELMSERLDTEQIARALYTDINLVGIKLEALRQKGYEFRQIEYKRNFLKG